MSELVSILKQTLKEPKKLNKVKYNHKAKAIQSLVIGDMNNHASVVAMRKLKNSIESTESDIEFAVQNATTPLTLEKHLNWYNKSIHDWNYPINSSVSVQDHRTGLTLKGYSANDWTKVVSCFMSHFICWNKCFISKAPMIILEHDALFLRKFNWRQFESDVNLDGVGVIGLNNPIKATRRANVFYDEVMKKVKEPNKTALVDVPWVDDDRSIPQGLAGNSAYILFPEAAEELINWVNQYGMWPNDALMCKQIFPWMKVSYPFYTKVQGIESTTTR